MKEYVIIDTESFKNVLQAFGDARADMAYSLVSHVIGVDIAKLNITNDNFLHKDILNTFVEKLRDHHPNLFRIVDTSKQP